MVLCHENYRNALVHTRSVVVLAETERWLMQGARITDLEKLLYVVCSRARHYLIVLLPKQVSKRLLMLFETDAATQATNERTQASASQQSHFGKKNWRFGRARQQTLSNELPAFMLQTSQSKLRMTEEQRDGTYDS